MLRAQFARTRKKNQSDEFEFRTTNRYKDRPTANEPELGEMSGDLAAGRQATGEG